MQFKKANYWLLKNYTICYQWESVVHFTIGFLIQWITSGTLSFELCGVWHFSEMILKNSLALYAAIHLV